MANEIRLRQNFLGGKVEDNPLSGSATTLTSAGLAYMSAVTSTSHMALILDPDGLFGEPEIVYVTAHSAGATTATIARGQEGTTGRGHSRDVDWVHGPTSQDFVPTSINRPQGAFTRRYLFDTGTDSFTTDTGSLTTSFGRLQVTTAAVAGSSSVLEPSTAANIVDGEMYADCFPSNPDSLGLYDLGVIFRATDANNHYLYAWRQGTGSGSSGEHALYKKVSGSYTQLASTANTSSMNAPMSLPVASYGRAFVRFFGGHIMCFYNEVFMLGYYDTTFTTGRVGVRVGTSNSSAAVSTFDNVTAYTLTSFAGPVNY